MSGRGWGLALGLTVLAAVAVVAPAGAASKTVEMEGQQYNPKRVEISADDTVVWEHQGEGSHTVTADNGSFDSSSSCSQLVQLDCMDKKGESFDHKFPGAGSFLYHCKVHGASGGQGMSGVVVVKAKAATPSTTAPPGSGTTATTRPGTVTTTTRAGVTTTSRPLSTSSTVIRSTTTTTGDAVFDVEPNEPPAFDPGDEGGGAAPAAKGSGKKGNSDTVAVIVALLLAVASAGGILLWRLRPGRS